MGVSKTSDHTQIKIKMLNPSQEPPAPIKAPNQDLRDIDVLCTLQVKIESQNLELGCIKISDHIIIKIMMLTPSQEPLAPTKVPNQDLKDMDVLCTFRSKIGSKNSEYGCNKDQ